MTMQNPSAPLDLLSAGMQERTLLRRLLDSWIEWQRRTATHEIVRHPRSSGRSPDSEFRLELKRRLLGQ